MDTEDIQEILRKLEKIRHDLLREELGHLDGGKRLLSSPHYSVREIGEQMLRRLMAQVMMRLWRRQM